MTLYPISAMIRAFGGTVWLCQNESYGFLFRADLGTSQIRVIVPKPGQEPDAIPPDPSCLTHVVKDVDQLRSWLFAISPTRTPKAYSRKDAITSTNHDRQRIPANQSVLR